MIPLRINSYGQTRSCSTCRDYRAEAHDPLWGKCVRHGIDTMASDLLACHKFQKRVAKPAAQALQ